MALKASRKAATSAIAWCPYSDSDSTRPARKAPRAGGEAGPGRRERGAEDQEQHRDDEDLLLSRSRQRPDEARDDRTARAETSAAAATAVLRERGERG